MKIKDYEVGKLAGESPTFRLYLGRYGEKEILIKVAKTFEDIDALAPEARIFRNFQIVSNNLEEMYPEDAKLHYDWLFPRVIDSWVEMEQDQRLINVYEILDAKLDDLLPLSKLFSGIKVDVRTSIWILGRFFKLYSFFELYSEEMDLPFVDYIPFNLDRFLIGPKYHRLVLLNGETSLRRTHALDFTKQISSTVLDFTLPAVDAKEEGYLELVQDMKSHGRLSFNTAHKELYQFVDETFGRVYHPFTFIRGENGLLETIDTANPFG